MFHALQQLHRIGRPATIKFINDYEEGWLNSARQRFHSCAKFGSKIDLGGVGLIKPLNRVFEIIIKQSFELIPSELSRVGNQPIEVPLSSS